MIEQYPEAHILFDTYHEFLDFSHKDGAPELGAQNDLGTCTTGNYGIRFNQEDIIQ